VSRHGGDHLRDRADRVYLQGVDRIMDLRWSEITGGTTCSCRRGRWCSYNFEHSDPALLFDLFEKFEREAYRLLKVGLVLPAMTLINVLASLQPARRRRVRSA